MSKINEKIKVLCVIDSLGPGGAERQLVNLAIGFKERGFDVTFLTYSNNTFYNEVLLSSHISEITVIESLFINRFLKIRRIIRKGNYNVVLSFLEKPNFVCELSTLPYKKWKLIVGERSANPDIVKKINRRLIRLFHLTANYIVANSYTNIDIIKRINPFIPNKKCKVIYNMIDFNKWRYNANYVFRSNGKLVLTILATHKYLKNLNGLIEGVNLLTESEKSQLIINWYGTREVNPDNSYSEGINKINKYKLDHIFNFYPTTNIAIKIISESDAIGLFSFYEGLPNVICEGMAMGKPIIASDVSDNSLLINVPKGGFLCDSLKKESISNSLSCLLACSPAELKTMGEYNRKKAEKLFDKNSIVDKYIKIITD